jgi:phosphatidylserine/phosphatidylglycerophosphate/cardiolipin synthase-like enzyme
MIEHTLVAAERHLGPRIAPLLHRRHEHTLRAAAIEPEDERRRREAAWWGDEPRWFAGGTPPRQHNRVTPLIDGNAFFERLCDEIARAHSYIYIAGWCLTPHVPLRRGTPDELTNTRLLSVLSVAAQHLPVRILLWGGALAVIQPTRSTVRTIKRIIERDGSGDLVCRLDHTAAFTHCHHQKAIVIDGQVAFVGGMDLTTYAGDRWDEHGHDLRAGVNWHDVTALIEGEAVADVERNFHERWRAVAGGEQLPHAAPHVDPAWCTPAQVVRTIPRRHNDIAPKGDLGIRQA